MPTAAPISEPPLEPAASPAPSRQRPSPVDITNRPPRFPRAPAEPIDITAIPVVHDAGAVVDVSDLIRTSARLLAKERCDRDASEIKLNTGEGKKWPGRVWGAIKNVLNPKFYKMFAHRALIEKKMVDYTKTYEGQLGREVNKLLKGEEAALLSGKEKAALVERFLGFEGNRKALLKSNSEDSVVDESDMAQELKQIIKEYCLSRLNGLSEADADKTFIKNKMEIFDNYKKSQSNLDNLLDYAKQNLKTLQETPGVGNNAAKVDLLDLKILKARHEHIIKEKIPLSFGERAVAKVQKVVGLLANPTIAGVIGGGVAVLATLGLQKTTSLGIKLGAVALGTATMGVGVGAVIGIVAGAATAAAFAYWRRGNEVKNSRTRALARMASGEQPEESHANTFDKKLLESSYEMRSAESILKALNTSTITPTVITDPPESLAARKDRLLDAVCDLRAREIIEDSVIGHNVNFIKYSGEDNIHEQTRALSIAKIRAQKHLTSLESVSEAELEERTARKVSKLCEEVRLKDKAFNEMVSSEKRKSAVFTGATVLVTAGMSYGASWLWHHFHDSGAIVAAAKPGNTASSSNTAAAVVPATTTPLFSPPPSEADFANITKHPEYQYHLGSSNPGDKFWAKEGTLSADDIEKFKVSYDHRILPSEDISVPKTNFTPNFQQIADTSSADASADIMPGMDGSNKDFYLPNNEKITADYIKQLEDKGYVHDIVEKEVKTPTQIQIDTPVKMTPEDYIANKQGEFSPEQFGKVSTRFHYDNGTNVDTVPKGARFVDHNEKQLHFGGKNLNGLDADGKVIYDVTRMKGNGSWFEDAQGNIKSGGFPHKVNPAAHLGSDPLNVSEGGRLEMLVRLKNGMKDQVFRVPAEKINGHIVFLPEKHLPSDVYNACWDTSSGKAVAKVTVETGITWQNQDGTLTFGEIATDVHKGASIAEIATTKQEWQPHTEITKTKVDVFQYRGFETKPSVTDVFIKKQVNLVAPGDEGVPIVPVVPIVQDPKTLIDNAPEHITRNWLLATAFDKPYKFLSVRERDEEQAKQEEKSFKETQEYLKKDRIFNRKLRKESEDEISKVTAAELKLVPSLGQTLLRLIPAAQIPSFESFMGKSITKIEDIRSLPEDLPKAGFKTLLDREIGDLSETQIEEMLDQGFQEEKLGEPLDEWLMVIMDIENNRRYVCYRKAVNEEFVDQAHSMFSQLPQKIGINEFTKHAAAQAYGIKQMGNKRARIFIARRR